MTEPLGDKRYLVKEIFGPTIQGEGFHAGTACVFLRFAVCNLACTWCDTDFAAEGANKLTADEICARLLELDRGESRTVIITGGEPALQWDQGIAEALRKAGFRSHMESNGTRQLAAPVDWLTVSPKPRFHRPDKDTLVEGLDVAECKVVVDGSVEAEHLHDYERLYASCRHWFLQPCMDQRYDAHLASALAMIEDHPRWRLSLQLHKIVGVP